MFGRKIVEDAIKKKFGDDQLVTGTDFASDTSLSERRCRKNLISQPLDLNNTPPITINEFVRFTLISMTSEAVAYPKRRRTLFRHFNSSICSKDRAFFNADFSARILSDTVSCQGAIGEDEKVKYVAS